MQIVEARENLPRIIGQHFFVVEWTESVHELANATLVHVFHVDVDFLGFRLLVNEQTAVKVFHDVGVLKVSQHLNLIQRLKRLLTFHLCNMLCNPYLFDHDKLVVLLPQGLVYLSIGSFTKFLAEFYYIKHFTVCTLFDFTVLLADWLLASGA